MDEQAVAQDWLDRAQKQSVLTVPSPEAAVEVHLREAQNAMRAAIESSRDAIVAAVLLNRVGKVAAGKNVRATYTAQAQDSLRAAILFAGAGLDRGLKSVVQTGLPHLIAGNAQVKAKFESFAATAITDARTQSVSPTEFVRLFLESGQTPFAVLQARWIYDLTDGSAQSVERVDELASALGVTDDKLRRRTKPKSDGARPLARAFEERNRISHELDVTVPLGDVRERLERIRAVRKRDETIGHVQSMLSVAQAIINDVAVRLDKLT